MIRQPDSTRTSQNCLAIGSCQLKQLGLLAMHLNNVVRMQAMICNGITTSLNLPIAPVTSEVNQQNLRGVYA